MKPCNLLAVIACACGLGAVMAPSVAQADDVGLKITGAAGARLAYFTDSDGNAKEGEWSRDEVAAMHLQIKAVKGDYAQVVAAGKPLWVDRDKIRVERKGPECAPLAISSAGNVSQIAGSRGAAKVGACQ